MLSLDGSLFTNFSSDAPCTLVQERHKYISSVGQMAGGQMQRLLRQQVRLFGDFAGGHTLVHRCAVVNQP